MSEHTPGPWMLGNSHDGCLTVTDGSKTICTVGEPTLFPAIEADARLIAAAPELLEALRDIIEAADDPDNARPSDLVEQINWEAIRSLIAKTERRRD